MKTFVTTILLLTLSFASTAKDSPGLRKELNTVIEFPNFLDQTSISGLVSVSIKVKENGKLEVTGMNASDDDLASYVRKQVESLILDNNDPRVGKEFYYKLKFEKR